MPEWVVDEKIKIDIYYNELCVAWLVGRQVFQHHSRNNAALTDAIAANLR
jgi:hypothetical protein